MNIVWENKEQNYINVEKMLRATNGQKIDLLLLPEMSLTGFSMNTDRTKESDNDTIKRMIVLAKKYSVAIAFGWVKDCGIKSENRYTVVSKEGIIISDYVKIHPFSYSKEDEMFQGGKRVPCFYLNDICFSSFICYDLRFPEIFQIASKNSNVILLAANWPEERSEHWKCLLRARAIENQVYIIAVNCVGKINGINYSGDSCIINPNGQVQKKLSGEEGILYYDLEDDVQLFRNCFSLKKDRKESLYCKMYDEFYQK